MGLIGNLAGKAAGAAAKAAAKKVGRVAETAVIIKAGEAIENKAKSRHAELMADEFGDRKLMVLRDLKSAGGRWEVYDDEGNYVYVAIGSLTSMTPKVVFYSPDGEELGSFKKKAVSIRSPFDQTQGDNFDYEITVAGRKLGLFRNKTISTVFDPFAAFRAEPGFTTLCYEFDYNGWELRNKVTNLQMYIVDANGDEIVRIDESIWENRGYYVLSHSNRDEELLYLMLLLAYLVEHDGRSRAQKVKDAASERSLFG